MLECAVAGANTRQRDGPLDILLRPDNGSDRGTMNLTVKYSGASGSQLIRRVCAVPVVSRCEDSLSRATVLLDEQLAKADGVASGYNRHACIVGLMRSSLGIVVTSTEPETELPGTRGLLCTCISTLRQELCPVEATAAATAAAATAAATAAAARRVARCYETLCSTRRDLIRNLVPLYRRMCPPCEILRKIQDCKCAVDEEIALEARAWWRLGYQDLLYRLLFCDPIALRFPPASAYRRDLVDKIVESVEKCGAEPHESLLRLQSELKRRRGGATGGRVGENVLGVDAALTFEYVGRKQEKTELITVKSSQAISDISLRIWPGAFALAEVALERPALFAGRRVLELGSGTGFTGAVILRAAQPARLILSDFEPSALDVMATNIAINMQRQGMDPAKDLAVAPTRGRQTRDRDHRAATPPGNGQECQVQVCRIDWSNVSSAVLRRLNPDIVVGADLVYSPDLIKPLLRVISMCMRDAGTLSALLVFPKRNPSTMEQFRQAVHKSPEISLVEWDALPPQRFPYSAQHRADTHVFELRNTSARSADTKTQPQDTSVASIKDSKIKDSNEVAG